MHLGRSSRCRECHRAAARDWRERNRDRVNAERRAAYREQHPRVERDCAVCGQSFTNRPDALVCGEECRLERKREQRAGSRQSQTTIPIATPTKATAMISSSMLATRK